MFRFVACQLIARVLVWFEFWPSSCFDLDAKLLSSPYTKRGVSFYNKAVDGMFDEGVVTGDPNDEEWKPPFNSLVGCGHGRACGIYRGVGQQHRECRASTYCRKSRGKSGSGNAGSPRCRPGRRGRLLDWCDGIQAVGSKDESGKIHCSNKHQRTRNTGGRSTDKATIARSGPDDREGELEVPSAGGRIEAQPCIAIH